MKIRAMATCLILMFGRLGAVGGSNLVGLLLYGQCEIIFYLYGALIFSKFICIHITLLLTQYMKKDATFHNFNFISFISGCSIVCFFLNTNPRELSNKNVFEIKCEP